MISCADELISAEMLLEDRRVVVLPRGEVER